MALRFTILGAGNGGQAIAAYLSSKGQKVCLWDRNPDKVALLSEKGEISMQGAINYTARLNLFTSDVKTAIEYADVVMVTTTATAHKELASKIAPYLQPGQMIVLNPGRTCGAIEFRKTLDVFGCEAEVYVAEAQTLIFACRLVSPGVVNIIGVKDTVFISAYPAADTDKVIKALKPVIPCFVAAPNTLHTGLENIGAIFHPCVVLFNSAAIERGEQFYFYRDMTPQIAAFIEKFDAERLAVGRAYGIELIGVSQWISTAYENTKGNTLCEKMINNPAYFDIKAPASIYTRQLLEDIPTGIVPITELGNAAGLKLPLMSSMIEIVSGLLGIDFRNTGRTLKSLGLEGFSADKILRQF